MSKDYYHILQVHEQAEQEVIEAAYKRLARKYHPDVNSSSGATAKMQELNEAYQVLKDPNKRADYDNGRRKSDSSLGQQRNRANEEKSNQQERQTQEQQERERVEQRRREQEAKKAHEREQEEKRKRDKERQENEERVNKETLDKKHRRSRIVAISVGSIAVVVIALIVASLSNVRSTDTASGTSPTASTTQTSQSGSNDLSETYAIVGDVIYNKKTNVVFTKPQEFFADSGKRSFDGLQYDRQFSLPDGLRFVDGRNLTAMDYKRLRGK